jgi:pimeloyl-ACP methyl ester carboxylesterase
MLVQTRLLLPLLVSAGISLGAESISAADGAKVRALFPRLERIISQGMQETGEALGKTERGADAGQGEFTGTVDIDNGRRLYLECHGRGSPTVILESGFRNTASIWAVSDSRGEKPVFSHIAEFTHVCAYDRPGTTLASNQFSRSDPVLMPRTIPEIVSDLHKLLTVAQIPGPYVLAAHSLGGIMARMYAATYPYSVVGLILADAYPENLAELLGPKNGPLFEHLAMAVPGVFKSYADLEKIDFAAATDLMRRTARSKPLRPLPLYVLSRGLPIVLPESSLPPGFSPDLEKGWREGQNQLAALLPDAQHRIARKSEHYIQVEQPNLVVNAVWQVWKAVRDGFWPNECKI